jgi:hypothetical protein
MLSICLVLSLLMEVQALFSTPSPGSLSNGLVAYYPFDGNANDLSGNNNDGIVH